LQQPAPSEDARSSIPQLRSPPKTPGGFTVGTPPPPTLNYLGAELFKSLTGADLTIVTYKSTGPLTNDLVGGHVMVAFKTLPPAISNIQAGKIKAIAVCAPTRLAALPDVPTAAEAGLPGHSGAQVVGGTLESFDPQRMVSSRRLDFQSLATRAGISPVGH